MRTDLEELLRDGLDRLTAEAELPSGLAARAMRGHRQRRVRVRASGAAGTALATAAVAVIAVSAVGEPTGLGKGPVGAGGHHMRYQTLAYVTNRIEQALAGTKAQIMVFSRHGTGAAFSGGSAPLIRSWSYGNVTKTRKDAGGVATSLLTVGNGKSTSILFVNYTAKTWSRETHRSVRTLRPIRAFTYAKNVCVGPADDEPGYDSGLWPQFVSSSLACGGFRIAGRATVSGVTEFKIVGTARDLDAKFVPQVMWVSAKTYLPVRIVYPWGYDQISWLRPTAANKGLLQLQVPPGFRHVAGVATVKP